MAIALVARAYCSLLGIVYPLLNTISWYIIVYVNIGRSNFLYI